MSITKLYTMQLRSMRSPGRLGVESAQHHQHPKDIQACTPYMEILAALSLVSAQWLTTHVQCLAAICLVIALALGRCNIHGSLWYCCWPLTWRHVENPGREDEDPPDPLAHPRKEEDHSQPL